MGMGSSGVFIPVGPKVAVTDQPTFGLSSPSEGVKTGPAGGDNIFVVRPLNEQVYSKLLEYVCTDLKKQLKLKEVKIALNLVTTSFGPTVENTVNREIGDYKNCEVVNTTTNSFSATDMTQQVLSIKDSGANVILSANFPAPSGVLVSQLRQNAVNIPFVGGASLNLAVDANSIPNLTNVVGLGRLRAGAGEGQEGQEVRQGVHEGIRVRAELRGGADLRRRQPDCQRGRESGSRPEGDQQGAGGDRLRRRSATSRTTRTMCSVAR